MRPFATIALFCLACAQMAQASDRPLSLCEVKANPARYAGKIIVIRGTVLQELEGRGLIDRHCPEEMIAFGSEAINRGSNPNAKFLQTSFSTLNSSKRRLGATVQGVYTSGRLDQFFVKSFWFNGKRTSRQSNHALKRTVRE
jgi:hypothetical protein